MSSVVSFLSGVFIWLAGQSGLLAGLPHVVQTVVGAGAAIATVLGIRKAGSDPSAAFTSWLNSLGGGWKTAAGGLIWIVGTLATSDLSSLPPTVGHWIQVAGELLVALGLYHASARAALAPPVKPGS